MTNQDWTVKEQLESNANYQRHFAVMNGVREIVRFYFTRTPVNNESFMRQRSEDIVLAHNSSLKELREEIERLREEAYDYRRAATEE